MSYTGTKQYDGFPLIGIRLTPPQLAENGLERERILDKLVPSVMAESVGVVTAPAGYGKSILLSQCFERYKRAGWNTAWLSLEEEDNDGGQFFFYFNALIECLSESIGYPLEKIEQYDVTANSRHLISLIIKMMAGSDKKFALFFDDYHVIKSKEIHDLFIYLLKHLPINLKVFIGSRELVPFPLAKLKAGKKLLQLDSDDLKFDRAEASTLFTKDNNTHLESSEFEKLYEKSGGWVSVLQLAAISVKAVENKKTFVESFSGIDGSVADFLAEEVLDLMPSEDAGVLMRLSIVERFSSPLCDAINSIENSTERLKMLGDVRYFVQKQDGDGYWYRLHPLLRDVLVRRLELNYPKEITELNRRASFWFESEGLMAGAIKHAVLAGEEGRALELLEEQGYRLMQKGFFPLMFSLIDRLPDHLLYQSRDMLMQLAWLEVLNMNFSRAVKLLDQLESVLKVSDDVDEEVWASFHTVESVFYCFSENLKKVDQVFEVWIPKVKVGGYVESSFRVAKAIAAVGQFKYREAKAELHCVMDMPEEMEFALSQAYAVCMIAIILCHEGRFKQAEMLLKTNKDSMLKRVGPRSDNVHLMESLLAVIHSQCGEHSQAEELFKLGANVDESLGTVEFQLMMLPAKTRLLLKNDNPEKALAYLIEMELRCKKMGWLRLEVCALHDRIKLIVDSGDAAQARAIFDEWLSEQTRKDCLSKEQLQQVDEYEAMIHSRLSLAEGDAAKAAVIVKTQLEKITHSNRVLRKIRLWVLLAKIYAESNDEGRSKDAFSEAFNLDQESVIVELYRCEGEAAVNILRKLSQVDSVDAASANNVIRQRHIEKILAPLPNVPVLEAVAAPETDAGPYYEMIESLTKRELATLKLLAEGLSNKEISDRLCIGTSTVKTHLHYAYGKLGVSRRTQAVRRLKDLGVFK